jgi:hypothetical protein
MSATWNPQAMDAEHSAMFVRRSCNLATAEVVADPVARAGQDTREAELDAALDMTFPASDPVAIDCKSAFRRMRSQ